MSKIVVRDFRESCWETSGLSTTKEGYLTGRILVTGAGVFPYIGYDGKIVQRLRSVDEVLKSVESLSNKPLTLSHPAELVSPENAKKLSVGFLGNVSFDGLNIFADCTITDAEAIAQVRSRNVRAVSAGYECMLEKTSGVWQGVAYDEIQRDIVYNHVALVFEGRAGDGVRFKVNDSAEFLKLQKDEKMIRKITLDSVEYEADEAVISALQKAQQNEKYLQASLDKATAEKDAAEAICKQKDEQLAAEKAKQLDETEVQKRVSLRLEMLDVAAKMDVKDAAAKSNDEIRKAVIEKAFAGIALDGKSEEYLIGLFDAAKKVQTKLQADNALANTLAVGDDVCDGTDEAVAKAKAEYDAAVSKLGKEN